MKKIIVSKALKTTIPKRMIKEMYFRIVTLPASGMVHQFTLLPGNEGTELIHSIPLADFNYSLFLSQKPSVSNPIRITAYDEGDKILMALTEETI